MILFHSYPCMNLWWRQSTCFKDDTTIWLEGKVQVLTMLVSWLIACSRHIFRKTWVYPVLRRKPFTFVIFFCSVNAGFFTLSSKTRSMVPTSNLCRNNQRPKNQINQYFSATCTSYLERTDKHTSIYTTN